VTGSGQEEDEHKSKAPQELQEMENKSSEHIHLKGQNKVSSW